MVQLDPTTRWPLVPIKRFAQLVYGDALPAEKREDGGAVPVYGSNGAFGFHSSANTLSPVILVGRKGSVGALNWSEGPAFAIDTVYFVDEVHASCDLRWLYWALQTAGLHHLSQDTGVPGLSREMAYGVALPLPPLPEQTAIAAFLDRETGKIDALVEEQKRLIELLKEKRQAVISHAVTKGLDPNARMKPSGVEWLGDVPEHWEVRPLRYSLSSITSGTSVNAIDTPAGAGELGVLKTSCVYTGRFDPKENKTVLPDERERVSCPVLRGSIVVSRMNTPDLVGAAGLVEEDVDCIYLPDRLWQVRILEGSAAFFHFWMQSLEYRAQVRVACAGTSSSMQSLGQDQFRGFVLAVPPADEQERIVGHLSGTLTKLARLTDEAEAAIELLQERRAALISAAVTGKIDVRDHAVEMVA